MVRYFSAAFGYNYVQCAQGLRYFAIHAPTADLKVFTDKAELLESRFHSKLRHCQFSEILGELPDFYQIQCSGQFHNAFKIILFLKMRKEYPTDDLCWFDADMLLLTDLNKHIKLWCINVINHGRRPGQLISCGNGLEVLGERYAIGGFYSLPPGSGTELLFSSVMREHETWQGPAPFHSTSGDQILLNHLIHRQKSVGVNWLTDDQRYIFLFGSC